MYLYQSSWFVVEGTTFVWNLTLSTSLISGNKPGCSDQTKQMQGEVDFDTLMMTNENKNKTFGASCVNKRCIGDLSNARIEWSNYCWYAFDGIYDSQ